MNVTPVAGPKYRGFLIGFAVGRVGFLPAWRSSMEKEWKIGCVYAEDYEDVSKLARACIDFNYKVEAAEAELGRKLTIDEMGKFKD